MKYTTLIDELTDRELEILQLVAEGLTNQQIADQLVISYETVKWHNKHIYGKLNASNRTQATLIAQELGLLLEPDIFDNLPRLLTPFVGREKELQAISKLVKNASIRLVTIIGTGGTGKTRVAIQVAHQHLKDFNQGVLFVPLISEHNLQHLITVIGKHLPVNFSETTHEQEIIDYLCDKNFLLILDNFEHLVRYASQVKHLLSQIPAMKILVTSRERLNLQGEHVYRLQGMRFTGDANGDTLAQSDAIQLFVERARRRDSSFAIGDSSLDTMIHICRKLEGIPLALELAASWVGTLTLSEILQQIHAGIDNLKTNLRDIPGHLRSIRAIFERSWSLLTQQEQLAYARLSVFQPGFSFKAAIEVTHIKPEILQNLVGKSLLWRDKANRLSFHQLLRDYAIQKLELYGTLNEYRAKHSNYYLQLIISLIPHIKNAQQKSSIEVISTEFDNIQVAWAWAVQEKVISDINAVSEGLFLFAFMERRFLAIIDLFSFALDSLERHGISKIGLQTLYAYKLFLESWYYTPHQRLGLVSEIESFLPDIADSMENSHAFQRFAWAFYHWNCNNVGKIRPPLLESLTYYQKQEDHFYQAWIQGLLAACNFMLGDANLSDLHSARGLEIARQHGNPYMKGYCLNHRVAFLLSGGFYAEGEQLVQEWVEVAETLGLKQQVAWAYATLAFHCFLRGAIDDGNNHVQYSLSCARSINHQHTIAYSLGISSIIAAVQEEYETARTLAENCLDKSTGISPQLSADFGLALAYCGLGDYRKALDYSKNIVITGNQRKSEAIMSWGLPSAVVALVNLDQLDVACMLLGYFQTQLDDGVVWIDKWSLFQRVLKTIEAKKSQTNFLAEVETGKVLDSQTLIQIMTHLSGEHI